MMKCVKEIGNLPTTGVCHRHTREVALKIAVWISLLGGLACYPASYALAQQVTTGESSTVQKSIFVVNVQKGGKHFKLPYRKMSGANCFRIVSKDVPRWLWDGQSVYEGRIESNQSASGVFANIPIPQGVEAGEYDFDVMVGHTYRGVTCYSDPVSLLVRVDKNSNMREFTICSGEKFSYRPPCLESGKDDAETYRWTRSDVQGVQGGSTSGTGGIEDILTNTTSAPVVVKYFYTVGESECYTGGDYEISVTVNPVIRFQVENRKVELCDGDATDIAIYSNTENVVYQWKTESFGVTGAAEGEGTSVQQVLHYQDAPGTVLYRISIAGSNASCVPEQTAVVRVKPLPEISLSWNEPAEPLALGQSIEIHAYPQNYSNYVFRFNRQKIEQQNGTLLQYDWKSEMKNLVTVAVTSEEGCTNADTLELTGPKLKLPNVITPNGDGINDRLFAGMEIEVFNRNGSLLYKGKEGWNGLYKRALVPSGTYLYVVHFVSPEGQHIMRKYHVYVRTK